MPLSVTGSTIGVPTTRLVRVGVRSVAHDLKRAVKVAEPSGLMRAVVDRVELANGAFREGAPIAHRDRGLERADELHSRLLAARVTLSLTLDRASGLDRLPHVERREQQHALPLREAIPFRDVQRDEWAYTGPSPPACGA
jgi:hypothetical protein